MDDDGTTNVDTDRVEVAVKEEGGAATGADVVVAMAVAVVFATWMPGAGVFVDSLVALAVAGLRAHRLAARVSMAGG